MKKRRTSPSDRYFFSQKQLKEYRWLESLMFAYAKREKRKLRSYYGYVCPCGCGPEPSEYPENYPYEWQGRKTPPVPPQPKKPTKRKKGFEHPMFSGKVVS